MYSVSNYYKRVILKLSKRVVFSIWVKVELLFGAWSNILINWVYSAQRNSWGEAGWAELMSVKYLENKVGESSFGRPLGI